MRTVCLVSLMLTLGLASSAHGEGNSRPRDELSHIAQLLRPLVIDNLPEPLYRQEKEWGRTSPTFSRIRWKGSPRVIKVPKRDGNWRRWTVTARDPDKNFQLTLAELPAAAATETPDDEGACRASAAMLVGVEFEQEIWENGVRLLRRTVRARVRVRVRFDYVVKVDLEKSPDEVLPQAVIRPRLSNVDVGYDDLVVEHIAGVGGTTAKLVGKAVLELVDEVKPSLERDLLAKANAAVEKAANKQQIRIGLSKWLERK